MAALGKSREIVSALMDLLHERGFGINQPSGLQHPPDFVGYSLRLQDVFEHSLHHDPVEVAIDDRNIVRIGDELHLRRRVDVEGKNFHIEVGIERLHSLSLAPATDHENPGTIGPALEFGNQATDISARRFLFGRQYGFDQFRGEEISWPRDRAFCIRCFKIFAADYRIRKIDKHGFFTGYWKVARLACVGRGPHAHTPVFEFKGFSSQGTSECTVEIFD